MIRMYTKIGLLYIKENKNIINNHLNSYTTSPCCIIDIRITKDVGAV